MEISQQFCHNLIIKPNLRSYVVYYWDRPSFYFPRTEVKEGDRTILTSSSVPIWRQISVEISPSILDEPNNFLLNENRFDCLLRKSTIEDAIVEEWEINGIAIHNYHPRRARTIDIHIVNVNLNYQWAKRTL